MTTVKIWERKRDTDREPDREIDLPPVEHGNYTGRNPGWVDPHWFLSKDIEHHEWYAFDVESDDPVTLNIHTNDSYHDPSDWGRPIERGLRFDPNVDGPPYKCELWGRVIMCVTLD